MAPNPLSEPGLAPTPVLKVRDTIVTVLSTMSAQPWGPTQGATKSKVAIGPIVGGLVGGIAAGLAAIALVIWYIRHRKKNQEAARRAYIRRRHRQMMQHAKSRSQYSGSSSIDSGTFLKTPSPTEKAFDPSVAFPAPPRIYMKAKEHDPFMTERGYGYEPKMILPAGPVYGVQQGYDPMLMSADDLTDRPDVDQYQYQQHHQLMLQQRLQQQQLGQHRRSMSSQRRKSVNMPQHRHSTSVARAKSTPTDSRRKSSPPSSRSSVSPPSSASTTPRRSPPTSPPSVDENRKSRSAMRAAAADQAAANAIVPISKRHRPSRPSPLSSSGAKVESAMMFGSRGNGGPSPQSSLRSSLRTTPSTSDDSSHAYAAAGMGGWGIALSSPELSTSASDESGVDFSRGSYYDATAEDSNVLLPPAIAPAREERVMSGLYAHDPFTEYHQDIGGIEAGLDADDDEVAHGGREPQNPEWI